MRIPEEGSGEELALNITPMIDVVFLLLIFFMVTTTFLDPEREIDIELPSALAAALSEDLDELVINVHRDGGVTVAGNRIDDNALVRALQQTAQRDPEIQVTIRGDRLVHHEQIVRVMDACGRAGLTNLAVGTMEGS